MRGRIWLPVIVLCALLLLGPAPAKEPVQAGFEGPALPESLDPLHFGGGDDLECAAARTGQDSFAVATQVKTTAASLCDDGRYFTTIHSGDIDGDGVDELLARSPNGVVAWRFNADYNRWDWLAVGGPFKDATGWDGAEHYATIHSADIDGDGVDELLGRWAEGMEAYRFNGTGWDQVARAGPFPDATGWNSAEYYAT